MASSRIVFKAGPGEADAEPFRDAVRRELLEGRPPTPDDSAAVIRRALDIVDAVAHLLEAISPEEVEASGDRAQIAHVAGFAGYWRVYSLRHRVLTDVFQTHRANFTDLARSFLAKRRSTSGSSSAPNVKGEPT